MPVALISPQEGVVLGHLKTWTQAKYSEGLNEDFVSFLSPRRNDDGSLRFTDNQDHRLLLFLRLYVCQFAPLAMDLVNWAGNTYTGGYQSRSWEASNEDLRRFLSGRVPNYESLLLLYFGDNNATNHLINPSLGLLEYANEYGQHVQGMVNSLGLHDPQEIERMPSPREGHSVNFRYSGRAGVTNELRRRPLSESSNPLDRNLNTMYGTCYVRYKGNIVYVNAFEGIVNPSAKVQVLLDSTTFSGDYKSFQYNEEDFDMSMPRLGWTNVGKESAAFLELVPGTYLRALSDKNCKVKKSFGEEAVSVRKCFLAAFTKEYTPFEKGIKEDLKNFVVSDRVAVVTDASEGQPKKHVMLNELKVGRIIPSRIAIKLNGERFASLKSFLEREVKCDVR